jgi:HlyD family secretion protein
MRPTRAFSGENTAGSRLGRRAKRLSVTIVRPVRGTIVLMLAFAGTASAAGPEPGRSPVGPAAGTPVMVARAAKACFSAIVHATGYLVPRTEAITEFPLEGYEVAEALAREGDTVVERQPLVRLVRAKGQNPNGSSNLTAALPATIVLKAIVPGTIVASTATVGAMTSPRLPPLFRVAIDGVIEANAEVSSIHLDKVTPDRLAKITPEGDREIGGRVRTIASGVDPVTQMGHVRIAIDGEPALAAGRFFRATIDTGESCGLSVPLAAVLRTTEGTSVQVVRGNVVDTVRVRVGEASNEAVEVQAGLQEGDVVVAHAGTSLRDGDRVAPDFIESPAQPTGR